LPKVLAIDIDIKTSVSVVLVPLFRVSKLIRQMLKIGRLADRSWTLERILWKVMAFGQRVKRFCQGKINYGCLIHYRLAPFANVTETDQRASITVARQKQTFQTIRGPTA
jgi:hypothetical protein